MQTIKVAIVLLILICIIFGMGIFANHTLKTTAKTLEQDVDAIETYTVNADWKNAETKLNELNEKWNGIQVTWSILIDHFEIDNINSALAKATQMIKFEDQSAALQEIASLQQSIKHIPEKEKFNIQNIF